FGWTAQAQGMMAGAPGLLGLALLVVVAVGAGAAFGAVFRYQPHAYAATLSSGLLFGLLAWIAGPLTLIPLLLGQRLTWSLAEASAAFPGLLGYLLYGGLTGIGFYGLVTVYVRARPEPEAVAAPATTAPKRVVVLGGGFAGVSAAQHLEQHLAGDPSVEVTL